MSRAADARCDAANRFAALNPRSETLVGVILH